MMNEEGALPELPVELPDSFRFDPPRRRAPDFLRFFGDNADNCSAPFSDIVLPLRSPISPLVSEHSPKTSNPAGFSSNPSHRIRSSALLKNTW